jgi:hypothetical protein
MPKMLFISTEYVVEEVDLNEDQIREKLNGWMEIVKPVGLPNYCLVVDDEGLLKNKLINMVGSNWYGFFKHGQPIVGDILVSKLNRAGEFVDLTPEDMTFLKGEIARL